MGQYTGTSVTRDKVHRSAMTVALVAEYQNLNSAER